MKNGNKASTQTNRVMALFADSALLFDLSKDATFADLADRLDLLGKRHTGMPTAIYLKSGMTPQPFPLHVGL